MPSKKASKSPPKVHKQAASKKGKKAPKELTLNQRLIKALANPLRVRLLAYMNDREWSPNELAEEVNEGLSKVSYHVKVLKDHKMIEMTKTEPRRGAVEHFYKAIERAHIPSWMAKLMPKSGKEIVGSDILEALENDLVASIKSGKFFEYDDCHASYTPVTLDALGFQEADEAANRFLNELLEIASNAANRQAESDREDESISVSTGVLVFASDPAKPLGSRRSKKKRG